MERWPNVALRKGDALAQPGAKSSDLTSPSITATCSNVTSPLSGSDLTSPSIADTCSSHVTPPLKSSDLTLYLCLLFKSGDLSLHC